MIYHEGWDDTIDDFVEACGQVRKDAMAMTPQLYEAINAKLQRIGLYTITELWRTVFKEHGDTKVLWAAHSDIERCRKDVKYEYLGLKESWL